jgi:Ca2+-binding RTX toxin-like protein
VFGNDVMAGGSDDDELFGELGDDIAQGDGLIERVPAGNPVLAFNPAPSVDPSFTIPDGASYFTVFGDRLVFRVQEAVTDGDDYLEGNGGNDRLYGNLGQDDLIGGSSTLFGLSDASAAFFGVAADDFARPDGADLLYGGAGSPLRLARLAATDVAGDGAVPADQTHGRDADVLMGDNANVYRLVGTGGSYGTGALANGYLGFNHDTQTSSATDGYSAVERIIARGVELVDYGYGFSFANGAAVGSFAGVGMGDLIYGEGGDDIAFGMTGDDVIFGGGEDDDLYGGQGADWMSGGNGIDGILGDDGLLYTSRNATAYGEPLYGILPLTATNLEITTPGNIQREIINIAGELKKTANLVAFNLEGDSDADVLGRMNDILFGGLGTDYLHGGFGDDAMSGAEALPIYFGGGTAINDFLKVQQLAPVNADAAVAEDPYWYVFAPYNPGDILRFQGNSTEDEFALYDEFFPRRKIMLDDAGNAVATAAAGVYDFLLNFDETEGPASFVYSDGSKPTDGDDRLFGDLGNDWIVGGSGRDHMWGGRGNDLLNMDDDHDSGPGGTHPNQPPGDPLDNTQSDEFQAYADIAYGGAGRDVLILNTGADRAIDWVGEYNSYIVPFAPFGAFHISRTLMPQLPEFLYALAVSDGTDTSIPDGARYAEQKTADVRVDDPQDPAQAARRGEPFGELGLVLQTDYDWQDQTGAPQDPQPGNLQGPREIMRRELFTDSGAATPFAATVGTFTVTSGKLKAAPVAGYAEAVSVYHLDQMQPDYMEILATVNMDKDKSGWKSNSYIIFDYQSPTDFKFAGVDAGLDKVRIGHRTESGWVVDQQINLQLRDGTNYKLTLVLHGTVASVYVNGANPASFDFRSALNDGLLGLGTDGAVARFDDFQVQKLPPVLTFDFPETFDAGIRALVASMGNWQTANGRLEGSPGPADYAFAGRFVDVAAASKLELEAVLRITGGSAGVVFDDAGDGVFKFAALLPGTDQVVLGHHMAHGFVIDATASYVLNTGTDYTLKVSLIGTGASVSVNGNAVLGFVYNGLLNDGGVGLLVRDGTAAFDGFSIRGDDPAYLNDGAGLRAANMGQNAAVEPLSVEQLEAALTAAGERLAAAGWFGLTPLDLRGISVAMEDLPGLQLAQARGHNLIVLDVNAAGHGWFADTRRAMTPSSGLS